MRRHFLILIAFVVVLFLWSKLLYTRTAFACTTVIPPDGYCQSNEVPVLVSGTCNYNCTNTCYNDAGCLPSSGQCSSTSGVTKGQCSISHAPTILSLAPGQEVFLNMYSNPTIGTMYDNAGQIKVTYKTVGAGNGTLQRKTYWTTGTLASTTTFTLPESSATFTSQTIGTVPNQGWTGDGAATLKIKNSGTNTLQITTITVYGAFGTNVMGTYLPANCGNSPCLEGKICVNYICRQGCSTDTNCPTNYYCDKIACMPNVGKISPQKNDTITYGTYTFSWGAVPDGSNYRLIYTLEIIDPATGKTLKSFMSSSPSYVVSLPSISDLQPGQTYQWTVWYSDGSPESHIELDRGAKWSFTVGQATKIGCFNVTKDTYVQENAQSTNYGTAPQLKLGSIFGGTQFYIDYFQFDASFPQKYDLATFRIHESSGDSVLLPFTLHKILSAWGETTTTWANKPSIDTVNVYADAEKWRTQDSWNFSSNNWFTWDITDLLKAGIPYGLAVADSRYQPSCDGSTSPQCRAGASRAGNIDTKEQGANQPQICLYSRNAAADCNTILAEEQSLTQNHFKICHDYNYVGVCFNKYTREYQGCVSSADGYQCTSSNTNAALNISCPSFPYTLPSSSSSSVCQKSSGDANCRDGVTLDDYEIWKCEYLGGGTCATSTPPTTNTADFDGKEGVTLVDFEIWRNSYYNSK